MEEWTPNELEAILGEIVNSKDPELPFSVFHSLRSIYNMLHIFRESPEEIHRRIKSLSDMEVSFDAYLEYATIYDILYGKYENLPLYINIEGLQLL